MALVDVARLSGQALEYMCGKADGFVMGVMTCEDRVERSVMLSGPHGIFAYREMWKTYTPHACTFDAKGHKTTFSEVLYKAYGNGEFQYGKMGCHVGIIMARENIGAVPLKHNMGWVVNTVPGIVGETLPIAVARAFAAIKFGKVVEVPDLLVM